MNPLHQTLFDLVSIPSVTGNEGRICTSIAERLLPLWTMQAVRRLGNSLIVGQQTGRPLITLYGHLDTVPEQDNAAPRIEGDRMFGLGTSDMKSGVAVMVHLMEDEEVRSGPYDVVGVFYDREEGPMDDNGLETVLTRLLWLDESVLGIVLEPTNLQTELGCNGAINADVIFEGKAAHSARPWLGENAVTKAGVWLTEMHEREPRSVDVGGLEFTEVFSVTKADGGIATNVLPATFTVNLNYRFPPSYSLFEAEARLREVAAAGDHILIKDRAPAGIVPEGNPYLRHFEEIVGGERLAKQGWTDVARLTHRGIPALNFGPGDPLQAHQVDEFVALASVDEAYAALHTFLSE